MHYLFNVLFRTENYVDMFSYATRDRAFVLVTNIANLLVVSFG